MDRHSMAGGDAVSAGLTSQQTGLTGQPKRRPYSGSSVSSYIRRAALEEMQAREAKQQLQQQQGGGITDALGAETPSPPFAQERRRPHSGSSIGALSRLQQEQQERWKRKLLHRQSSLDGSATSVCNEGISSSSVEPSPRDIVYLSPRDNMTEAGAGAGAGTGCAAGALGAEKEATHMARISPALNGNRSRPGSADMLQRAVMEMGKEPRPHPSNRRSRDGAGAKAAANDGADDIDIRSGYGTGGVWPTDSGGASPLQHAARMAWLDMPLSQRLQWSQTSDSVSATLLLPMGKCWPRVDQCVSC